MQVSWLAIALLALVVAVGAFVGIRQNGGAVQRRATALSFVVLAVAGIVSCIIVPLLKLTSLLPLFALISFILPLAVYAAIVSMAGEPSHATRSHGSNAVSMTPAHAKVARMKPLMVSFKEDEDEAAAPARVRFIAPLEKAANERKAPRASGVKRSRIPETIPTVDKEALLAAHEDESKNLDSGNVAERPGAAPVVPVSLSAQRPTEQHESKHDEPVQCEAPTTSYPPPLGEVKLKYSKPSSVSETPAPVVEQTATPVFVEATSITNSQESSATKEAPLVVSPEPMAPASEPDSQPMPGGPTSETCFVKATMLKGKGAHAVAARLFAESATLSSNESDRRRARFEELTCYVKANQPDRARTLATELREQSRVMTRIERVKLDAVTRML